MGNFGLNLGTAAFGLQERREFSCFTKGELLGGHIKRQILANGGVELETIGGGHALQGFVLAFGDRAVVALLFVEQAPQLVNQVRGLATRQLTHIEAAFLQVGGELRCIPAEDFLQIVDALQL